MAGYTYVQFAQGRLAHEPMFFSENLLLLPDHRLAFNAVCDLFDAMNDAKSNTFQHNFRIRGFPVVDAQWRGIGHSAGVARFTQSIPKAGPITDTLLLLCQSNPVDDSSAIEACRMLLGENAHWTDEIEAYRRPGLILFDFCDNPTKFGTPVEDIVYGIGLFFAIGAMNSQMSRPPGL